MSRAQPGASGAEPKVKGVAFRSVMSVAEDLLGPAAVDQALNSLPDAQREMLRYMVIHTGWYPISLYRTLWQALLDTSGQGEDLVRRVGAGAIRRDMTGVYRMAFKLLSPETVFSVSGKMFNHYYDTGSLQIESKKRWARASYSGCRGFDRTMWDELAGAGEELIRMAGGRDPRMTIVRGGHHLTDDCQMLLEWT